MTNHVKCATCKHRFNTYEERPGPLGLVNSCRVGDTKRRYATKAERICVLYEKAKDTDIEHFTNIYGGSSK